MRNRRDIIVPDVPHHFILRGNNKRTLFSYAYEYRYFLKLMAASAHDNRIAVHAVALMQNHVHLIATPKSQELASRFVQRFAQTYSLVRNKQREHSGKLFEQRFVSIPLGEDAAVARATAYVDLNPVRAGTENQRVWSTYHVHVGNPALARLPSGLWTPSRWYLGLGATDEERGAAYAAWLKERGRAEDVRAKPREIWLRRPDRKRAA